MTITNFNLHHYFAQVFSSANFSIQIRPVHTVSTSLNSLYKGD